MPGYNTKYMKTVPINKRVAEAIERQGWTLHDVAKRAKWSVRRMQRLVGGKTRITAEDVETIARVIKLSVRDLFGDHGDDL